MKKTVIMGISAVFSAGLMMLSCGVTNAATTAEENAEASAFEEASTVSAGQNYPVIEKLENRAGGLYVKWSEYDNASRYRFYVKDSDRWNCLTETTATEFLYTAAKNDTEAVYTVRALNSSREFVSGYYPEGWTHTFLAAPQLRSVVNWDNAVELKWSLSSHASGYRIMRRASGEAWTVLGDDSDGFFEDFTAQSGKQYYYTLVCLDSEGNQISGYTSGTANVHTDMPEILSFQNDDGGVKVSWNRPDGAVKFRLYEKTGSSWNKLVQTDGQSFFDKKVTDDTIKTYTLRAMDKNGRFISGYSKTGWSNAYLANPKINSITNTAEGVVIKWTKAKYSEKYRIYRKTVSERSWHGLADTASDSYTDRTAADGAEYLYTLRCVSNDGKSFMSYHDGGVRHTFCAQPEITRFDNTETAVKISWNKCKGAYYYRIYVREGSRWRNLQTTTALSYIDREAESNVSRNYTVRALDKNSKFITGYNSDGWSHTFYEAPKLKEVVRNGSGILISWQPVSGIKDYRVYRKELGGGWNRLCDSVSGTSFTDNSFSADKTYTYTVRCLDSKGSVVSDYYGSNPYYTNGESYDGFKVINGQKHYFEKGIPAVNRIVSTKSGSFYFDKDGVICESEEIKLAVSFVLRYGKGSTNAEKFKSCFNALWNYYPYEMIFGIPKTGDKIKEMAIHVFENKKGNCFCNAAAVTCIARVLGYDSRTITGMIHSVYGGTTAHGWAEVNVDGKWLICDADEQRRNPADKYFMTTYEDYKIKPLNYEHCYTLSCSGGKSSWTKNY